MPIVSRFLGIIITMYYNDHAPPHFHAKYGDYEVVVNIESGIVSGQFPRRAMNLVLEWYQQHQLELKINWNLARQRKPLQQIAPLE